MDGSKDVYSTMNAIIQFVTAHWTEIIAAIAGVMVTARIIVKLTPTPKDDTVLEKVVVVLKHLGLNIDPK